MWPLLPLVLVGAGLGILRRYRDRPHFDRSLTFLLIVLVLAVLAPVELISLVYVVGHLLVLDEKPVT